MLSQRVATVLLLLLLLFAGLLVFLLPPLDHTDRDNRPQTQTPLPSQQNKPPENLPPQDRQKEEFVKNLNQTRLKELAKKLTYWNNNPKKNTSPRPINHDRFLTWMPYSAGLNNRRISMEIAFVLAYITNRTLVLPPLSGGQHPFPSPFLMEELHEEKDLRAGIPLFTWREWIAYSNRQKIWDDTIVCPWDLKYGNDVFVFPKAPEEEEPHFQAFAQYLSAHREILHIRDPAGIKGFTTAKNLYFPEHHLFNHFYTQIYFTPESPYQMKDITKVVRDYVHFPEGVLEFTARILYFLPSFGAMHYRKDDFVYETAKIEPQAIFNATHHFYQDNETIYVSTDEQRHAFLEKFVPVFSKRYRVVTLFDFKHLLYDMPPMYEPMVEMFVCSSARIFVGTMLSTFSGYIQRLRGYHKWIENKGPHYTHPFNQGVPRWGQERDEAWNLINDEE